VLDVGSADGPSVDWMAGTHQRFMVDVDSRGLVPGHSACASLLALPFPDASFDVVGAFDVLEHCAPEAVAMAELARVVAPGGRLLMSVPAYQWAWSDHDVQAGHHRRYTKARLLDAIAGTDLVVHRATYAFGAVFPFFAAERVVRRIRRNDEAAVVPNRLPDVSPRMERTLMGLTRVEQRYLARHDVPFGSSVLVAAVKGGTAVPDATGSGG
jgi:SAM-dependent methyltransferase